VIPLRDNIPHRRFPVVTTTLIAINVLVFLWELSLGPALDRAVMRYGVIPAHLVHGGDRDALERFLPLVTSMFLHGGWAHIVGNMLYLWIFGDNVEDRLGRGGYLLFYLACGVASALAQVAAAPGSTMPMVGASGAIAGVLGAYIVLYPRSRVLTLIPILIFPWLVMIPAAVFLGLWFLLQLLSGSLELSARAGHAGGVAWFAHVGGFAVGAVIGLVLRARPDRSEPYEVQR